MNEEQIKIFKKLESKTALIDSITKKIDLLIKEDKLDKELFKEYTKNLNQHTKEFLKIEEELNKSMFQ